VVYNLAGLAGIRVFFVKPKPEEHKTLIEPDIAQEKVQAESPLEVKTD
jgi:hypothetical protein